MGGYDRDGMDMCTVSFGNSHLTSREMISELFFPNTEPSCHLVLR